MTNETSPSAGLKRCSGCKQWLERGQFGKRSRSKDGLQYNCRPCSRKQVAAVYARHRERNATLTLEERQAGPPKRCGKCKRILPRAQFSSNIAQADGLNWMCQVCNVAQVATWGAANPQVFLAREYRTRGGAAAYEITKRDLDRLWHRQQGKCAYCGVATERNAGVKGAQTDHVIPVSRGGIHSIGNIVYACHRCNGSGGKWNLTLMEWRLARLRAERTSGDLRP